MNSKPAARTAFMQPRLEKSQSSKPKEAVPAAVRLDLSRFGAAPLIAYCAAKETNYGTNADGRIS